MNLNNFYSFNKNYNLTLKKMERNQKNDIASLILVEKCLNKDTYETTYKSSYGNFYPKEKKQYYYYNKYPHKYNAYNLTNISYNNSNYSKNRNRENLQKTKQEKNINTKPKLLCPNCINEDIIKSKSKNRIKRREIYETEYFEDKMKTAHEYKKNNDIKNRENRAKDTYVSLFKNRDRSAQPYNKIISKYNNKNYFGNEIEYGILRCRNRELKNDKKLFGLNLLTKESNIIKYRNNATNNLKYNKSWVGPKNYLLDKTEYSLIITRQMETDDLRNKKQRYETLKEENNILNEQLKKEKNDINREICSKNKRRYEMNRANSYLLRHKKYEEYKQKKNKMREKECINLISKKQIEDIIKKIRQKRMNYIKIDKENLKMFEDKKLKNKKEKIIMNRNYEGLIFQGMENKSCEKCNRLYPKNVLSYTNFTEYNNIKENNNNEL